MESFDENRRSIHPVARIVARNFLILGSGEFIGRGISSLALIYVARRLGVESFGLVGFAASIILYLAAIADGGIESLGPREIAEDRGCITSMVPSVIMARMVVSAALTLGVAIVGLLVLTHPEGVVLATYGLTLLAVSASTRWVHIGLESTCIVAVTRTVSEVLKVSLVLAFVTVPADVAFVPVSQFFGDTLTALLLALWLHHRGFTVPIRLNLAVVRPVFARSWPLMLTTLLGLSIYNLDLVFLKFFHDTSQVGYYHAAYVLISFIGILGNTTRLSLLPTLVRLRGNQLRQQELFQATTAAMFAVGFPIAVGGYLLAPQMIELVFGIDYEASSVVLQLLVWSIPVLFLRSVFQAALVARGLQDRVLRMTCWAALLNVLANLVMIPRYGMYGAAVATVTVEVVRMLIAKSYAYKGGFPLASFTRFWRTIVATAAMGGTLLVTWPSSLWIAVGTGAGAYFSTLTLVGGIQLRRGELPTLSL